MNATAREVTRDRACADSLKFLPDSLTLVGELEFLTTAQALDWSRLQGRSYTLLLGLLDRSICAGADERSRGSPAADPATTGASTATRGHAGTACLPGLARALQGSSKWAVLALACQLRLLAQAHQRLCIAAGASTSPPFKNALRPHWRRQYRRGLRDELSWRREDARTTFRQKDRAVEDLLELMLAVDGVVQRQAVVDTRCFLGLCSAASFTPVQQARLGAQMLRAYRWQYIASGACHPRFRKLFEELTTPLQRARAEQVLTRILGTLLPTG